MKMFSKMRNLGGLLVVLFGLFCSVPPLQGYLYKQFKSNPSLSVSCSSISGSRRATISTLFASVPSPNHGEHAYDDVVTIPSRGIIDYIGKLPSLQSTTEALPATATTSSSNTNQDIPTDPLSQAPNNTPQHEQDLDEVMARSFYDLFHNSPILHYHPPTVWQRALTKFRLWTQKPWLKISERRVILKAKIGGSLPLESPSQSLFSLGARDPQRILSLQDAMNLFMIATYDPRIVGIYLEIDRVNIGYAKIHEIQRAMRLYQESGKQVVAFMTSGSEREYYLASQCDAIYMPPEGGLDLRGFASAPQFLRGVFDKIGVEPQVQRIGKYKSFGDSYNRTDMSEAQREVISSLLTESSENWIRTIAQRRNQSISNIRKLFVEDANRSTKEFKEKGLLTGVMYADQVEALLRHDRFAIPKSFSLFDKVWDGVQGVLLKMVKVFKRGKQTNARQLKTMSLDADYDLQKDFEYQPRRRLDDIWQTLHTEKVDAEKSAAEDKNIVEEEIVKDTVEKDEKTEAVPSVSALPVMSIEEAEMKESSVINSNKQVLKLFGADQYLRKVRKASSLFPAMPIRERRSGKRIAIISAEGGINEGESSSSGLQGATIGSDTVIAQLRRARFNPSITSVVLRIDSPGGSALASDLVWRELRALSKVKPVVASMVDVAASGGYFFSMGCDEIVADDMTVTGSIGVVLAKFNTAELNKRIGLNVETVSIGKYAEFSSNSKPFTEEEEKLFESVALRAYTEFITKAAASRSMELPAMQEIAQGRVWTGRQARERGLIDHEGGLYKALAVAEFMTNKDYLLGIRDMLHHVHLSNITTTNASVPLTIPLSVDDIRVEYFKAEGSRGGLFGKLGGSRSIAEESKASSAERRILALASEEVFSSDLVGSASFGTQGILADLGLNAQTILMLKSMGLLTGLDRVIQKFDKQADAKVWLTSFVSKLLQEE